MLHKLMVLALAGAFTSGLAGMVSAQSPKRGGTLTYAVTAEAPTFDCHATTTYAAGAALVAARQDRPERLPEDRA